MARQGKMTGPWPAPDLLRPPSRVCAGAVIAAVGERINNLFLIDSGLVGRFISADGRSVLEGMCGTGTLIGVEPAMTTGRFATTVRAMTDCILRALPLEAFRRVQHRPDVGRWLNTTFAAAEIAREVRAGRLAFGGTTALVIDLLTALMSTAGRPTRTGGTRLMVPLQVTDIANYVGATREHTSRILSDLETRGQIKRIKGWLIAPPGSALCDSARAGGRDA